MKCRFLLLPGVLLLLGGCASMSAQGRRVEAVRSPAAVAGMAFVGNVATSSPLAGLAFQEVSYQNALNKALNETAALGGTHLLLDEGTSSRFWGVNQTVRGKAYRMEAGARREAGAGAGGMRQAADGTLYLR